MSHKQCWKNNGKLNSFFDIFESMVACKCMTNRLLFFIKPSKKKVESGIAKKFYINLVIILWRGGMMIKNYLFTTFSQNLHTFSD